MNTVKGTQIILKNIIYFEIQLSYNILDCYMWTISFNWIERSSSEREVASSSLAWSASKKIIKITIQIKKNSH